MSEFGRTKGISSATRWSVILSELAFFYLLIYLSIYFKLSYQEYLRFMLMIPLYQAGVWFGLTGGIFGGILATLLYIPVLFTAPEITGDKYGIPNAVMLILVMITFGIFIGVVIGRGRKTQTRIGALSEVAMRIARQPDAAGVLEALCIEAAALSEARIAAALIGDGKSDCRGIEVVSGKTAELPPLGSNHPLSWAAREQAELGTNSAGADPRFARGPAGSEIKSLIVLPVADEETVYGSLLLADRAGDEVFSQHDLEVARLLSRSAARAIHNINHERKRQEEKHREERMQQLFSRFVSSAVADHVLKNPDLLSARRQEVTILVSDIRDFTHISEILAPHEIVGQLNEYFTRMVDIIFENNGTIDKFIGDCIIAYWGAPALDPDHPNDAARAAVRMAASLDELNASWSASGKTPFRAGIGLHTCEALMGTLGDDRKRAFTILGEEVDTAMRIESLTKEFGARLIVSGATAARLDDGFKTTKLAGDNDIYRLETE